MATTAANAERYDGAQRRIQAAMERISKNAGFPPPTPPSVKIEDRETRTANDADRAATFLEQVANSYDPAGAAKAATPQALGGIGDGYNQMEEDAKAAKKGKGKAGAAATDEGEEEETGVDPVKTMNATEAVDAVSRMRSPEKLQQVIDNDQRASVKDAASKRLAELKGT